MSARSLLCVVVSGAVLTCCEGPSQPPSADPAAGSPETADAAPETGGGPSDAPGGGWTVDPNDVSRGPVDGTANDAADEATDGAANGISDGTSDGRSDGASDGAAERSTDSASEDGGVAVVSDSTSEAPDGWLNPDGDGKVIDGVGGGSDAGADDARSRTPMSPGPDVTQDVDAGAVDAGSIPPAGPSVWAPCSSDEECPDGTVCNEAYGQTYPGLCSPKGGLGWLCTRDEDCADDASCEALAADGDIGECSPTEPYGQPCSASSPCPSGLVCNTSFSPTAASPGTCLPPGRPGFPCRLDDNCAPDHHCAMPVKSTLGRCIPNGTAEAPCDAPSECSPGLECTLVTWAPTLQCQPSGAAYPGCLADWNCPSGTVCVGDGWYSSGKQNPACRPPGSFGSLCGNDSECATPFVCSMTLSGWSKLGLCLPPTGGTGTPCVSDSNCAPGTACATPFGVSLNACGVPAPVGAPCLTADDCAAPSTCTDWYGTWTCQPGLLAKCASDNDCLLGLVCAWSYGGIDGACELHTKVEYCQTPICHYTACDGCACCDGCDIASYDKYETVFCGQCVPSPAAKGIGDPCGRSVECASGLACSNGLDGHQCEPALDADASCLSNAECASGLVCVSDDAGSRCLPTRTVGETCDESMDCDPVLVCGLGEHGRCYAPLYSPCEDDGGCAQGLVCANVLGGADGTCFSVHTIKVTGYTCMETTCGFCSKECPDYGDAPIPYECGQCIPAPQSVPVGLNCHDDGSCVVGAICGSDHLCRSPGKPGESCTVADECVGGLICRLSTCGLLGTLGDGCNSEGDCEVGLRCRPNGVGSHECAPVGLAGEACDDGLDCAPKLACLGSPPTGSSSGKIGACGRPRSLGAPCAYSTDCKTGLLCAGRPEGCVVDHWGYPCNSNADCGWGRYCDQLCFTCL